MTRERGARAARLLIVIVAGAIVLVALAATPGSAHWRSGVYIDVGPFWWGPPYWTYAPYWPYYASPPYYVYPPPPVIVEEPRVYIQQPPPQPSPPAATAVTVLVLLRERGRVLPDRARVSRALGQGPAAP